MNKSWLKYKVEDIKALEDKKLEEIKQSRPDLPRIHVPFGFMNEQWTDLKNCMEQNDELWFFCSEEYTWGAAMCGRAGYAVLRDGQPVSGIYTKMS